MLLPQHPPCPGRRTQLCRQRTWWRLGTSSTWEAGILQGVRKHWDPAPRWNRRNCLYLPSWGDGHNHFSSSDIPVTKLSWAQVPKQTGINKCWSATRARNLCFVLKIASNVPRMDRLHVLETIVPTTYRIRAARIDW